jgi:hypothetical protein
MRFHSGKIFMLRNFEFRTSAERRLPPAWHLLLLQAEVAGSSHVSVATTPDALFYKELTTTLHYTEGLELPS